MTSSWDLPAYSPISAIRGAMVPTVPEWRYQSSGNSMPWYPSVRLYRQQTAGEWGPMLESVARDLDLQQAAK